MNQSIALPPPVLLNNPVRPSFVVIVVVVVPNVQHPMTHCSLYSDYLTFFKTIFFLLNGRTLVIVKLPLLNCCG